MTINRLGVLVNHCAPFHVGGSEKVVQQITESMHDDFGMECHVISKYATRQEELNGIHIHKQSMGDDNLVSQLNGLDLDHILTYSDSCYAWPTIVRKADKIHGSKSVALVGMNYMRSHGDIGQIFASKKNRFTTITHSDNYIDYTTCQSLGIPVKVIPNAINLQEFEDQKFSFREKHGIKTEKMILCVSNFFPGKGQEHLYHILQKLERKGHDFTVVFISTKVNFAPAESLYQRYGRMLKKASFKHVMLRNIPRSDTVQAFREADVFAFPSQVEVAPLVVLECMACSLPWVSLNVGNTSTLEGGLIVESKKKVQGRWHYSTEIYDEFTDCLDSLLTTKHLRTSLGSEGRRHIVEKYDWDKIKHDYKEVFCA